MSDCDYLGDIIVIIAAIHCGFVMGNQLVVITF